MENTKQQEECCEYVSKTSHWLASLWATWYSNFDTQAGIILILDSTVGASPHLSALHKLRYWRAESDNCISYYRALSWARVIKTP